MAKKILFISYNGMTDPLGQSQVLPYMERLAKLGFQISILSSEKEERLFKEGNLIRSLVDKAGITWHTVPFHDKIPFFSKIQDKLALKKKAIELFKKERYDLLHCRNYVPAEIGLDLNKKFGVKFIFDLRGFWADEKKDSGHWDVRNPFYMMIYNHYKKIEKRLLLNADSIVVLTHEAKNEIGKWNLGHNVVDKINVIPCCADLTHFSRANIDYELKKELVRNFGLEKAQPVLCYLGSIGNAYAIREMLELFSLLLKKKPTAKFLFFSKDKPELVISRLHEFNIPQSSVEVTYVPRKEIPTYLSLCDFSIFFYFPTPSRKACSPTKFAEISGMGLPVICNSVGDLNNDFLGGLSHIVVPDLSTKSLADAVERISFVGDNEKEYIREFACKEYDLENGVRKYQAIYNNLLY